MGNGPQIGPGGMPYYTIPGDLTALEGRAPSIEQEMARSFPQAAADARAATEAAARMRNMRLAGVPTGGVTVQQGPLPTAPSAAFNPAAGRAPVPAPTSGQPAALGAAPAQVVNPFVDPDTGQLYTPQQLAQQVQVGGTSTSSTSVRPGDPSMLQAMPALKKSLQARIAGVQAETRAEAAKAEASAAAREAHEMEQAGHQALVERQQAKVQEQIEEHDEQYQQLRADANQEINTGRWVQSQNVFQAIALTLAAGAEGFVRGYRGQKGNSVLEAIERSIDRDIKAQQADLATKRWAAGEERNAIGALYAKLGDMRQAEAQYRLIANEQIRSRLATIADRASSPIIKGRAEQNIAGLEGQFELERAKAASAARDQVTRTSGGSTQRVPLFKVLQAQAAAMQENAGKPLPKIDKNRDEQLTKLRSLRSELAGYYNMRKKLSLPAIGPVSAVSGGHQAVEQKRKELTDEVIAVLYPGATVAQMKLLKGTLGGQMERDETVATLVKNLNHSITTREDAALESAAAQGQNVAPFINLAVKSRKRFQYGMGGKGH